MAEVVTQSAGQAQQGSNGSLGFLGGLWTWISHYWWIFLIIFFLIFLVFVAALIFYFFYKKDKRKDHMYVFYERTVEAAKLCAKKEWVKKKRRWWQLIFGLPLGLVMGLVYLVIFQGESWVLLGIIFSMGFLFWLPIILIWYKDHSMKIKDFDNMTIGYYRGHCLRMDGYIYMLCCVGKKWVFFQDIICLKLPRHVLTTKKINLKDKEGNKITKEKFDWLDIDNYVWNERDNYIKIPMVALAKEDTYYFAPTFVDENKIPIDMRQKIIGSMHFATGIQMSEQAYSHLGKVTNNAVDSNPHVVEKKKSTEKEHDSNSSG